MNQYIANEPQAKAINDGARLLIVGIGKLQQSMLKRGGYLDFSVLPLKQDDEIFIAEEFNGEGDAIYYRATHPTNEFGDSWQPASEMTKQQSRFKFKVGEVSVKRVQDISISEIKSLMALNYAEEIMYWEDWLKDQGIDYSANPWVALAELVKEK